MERKRQAAAEVFYCFKTDAPCTNKKAGNLLVPYLFGELSPATVATFEKHMRGCTVCGAAVMNAWNIRAAVKAKAKAGSQKAAATGQ